MPNLYITPAEIKAVMPDTFPVDTIKYDSPLLRLANVISRAIDNHCHRVFFPSQATRYFDGSGKGELWIPDLLEITSVSYSVDNGQTYTALSTSDYFATADKDYNSPRSYSVILVNPLSTKLAFWPACKRAVRITGIWGYADDRAEAWEDSGDTVQDDPLAADATAITVADADGPDLFGMTPRFQAGQLAKLGSEIVEITAIDAEDNKLIAARGRNGSAAAEHAKNTTIYLWRVPEPVRQAAVIQAVRQLLRGSQGFGEARANAEIGQMWFVKSLDPEARMFLEDYVNWMW